MSVHLFCRVFVRAGQISPKNVGINCHVYMDYKCISDLEVICPNNSGRIHISKVIDYEKCWKPFPFQDTTRPQDFPKFRCNWPFPCFHSLEPNEHKVDLGQMCVILQREQLVYRLILSVFREKSLKNVEQPGNDMYGRSFTLTK